MKRLFAKTLLSASLLLGAISLSACGGEALPTSSHEKVRFAFNGVEKSFRNPSATKRRSVPNNLHRLGGSNPESGLSTIYRLFKDEDRRDDFVDDVEYNQPPMVQFQYLKKVFEKVGNGYEFGTKYFDTVTGDVYLDINTGLESKQESDKFNYTLGLGMDININDSDLITADVSFDIKIARGQEEYKTKWYVAIELNYDMKNSSPNYTMTMVTENNESELPYYQHYTYEYDYVDVKNSQINEWRKFCMDNNHRLVKDSEHPTFDSYTGEDSIYKIDACSWYKDGVYYKNKRPRQLENSEAKTVGQALYGDLGLNATEINAEAFFNKNSTPNSVLKTCYQEFGNLAKKDVIYSLLTKEEQGSGGQQQQQNAGIRAMNGDLSGWVENYHIPSDLSIGEVFNGFVDGDGEKTVIRLFYTNQDGGLLDEIKDLGSLSFFFGLQGKEATVYFDNLGETLESAYNKLVQNGQVGEDDLSNECAIIFMDKNNEQIYGSMPFYYSGDLPSTYVKPEWPNAFKNLGIPEYDGEKVEFAYSEDAYSDGNKYLNISHSTFEEGEAYCQKLLKNGFKQDFDYSADENEVIFKKAIDDNENLYIAFKYGKSLSTFRLTAHKEMAPQPVIPDQPYRVYAIGDFNNWGKNGPQEFVANYEDGAWTFTLEGFHVNANESFAFVTNISNPQEGFFGYHHLIDDPRGMFDMDYERGEYALRANQEFTATFSVGDGLLHVDFNQDQSGILYLTLIGSFNSWSETDGLIEMEKNGGTFQKLVSFDAGVQFKIMQNHSWEVNYGYDEIKAFQSADMKARFGKEEQYGNVVVLQPLTFVLTATSDDTGHAVFKVTII